MLYTATAGLEIGIGTATVEGGGIWGSGVGGSNGAGFYLGAAITGYRSPGCPRARTRSRSASTRPRARAGTSLCFVSSGGWRAIPISRRLRSMLKAEPADSLAHAEEFGDAIRMLRANGKKVVCDSRMLRAARSTFARKRTES